MNLTQAIKSGRPFRRKSWLNQEHWISCPDMTSATARAMHQWCFIHQDLVADDWEIQAPTVTINRTQFWEAVHSLYQLQPHQETSPRGIHHSAAAHVARKLGLDGP